MKVALRTNFPATARAVQRGLLAAHINASETTADEFGQRSQAAIRGAMVQTALGRMRGAVRYSSSRKRRKQANRLKGLLNSSPITITQSQGFAAFGQKSWAVVFNVGGDRSLGAFDAYTARPSTQIRPKGGKRWLAFPTNNIPKRVGRNKITPALWNTSGLARSIGPLVFIKGVSPNVAYLAVRNVSVTAKTGGKARALGKRGGVGAGRVKRDLLVAFILIRGTTRQQRLDPVRLMELQMGPALIRYGNLFSGMTRTAPVPMQPLFSASGAASGVLIPIMRA